MFKKDFLYTFILALGLALLINYFLFPTATAPTAPLTASGELLHIESTKKSYGYGENIEIKVATTTSGSTLLLTSSCPEEYFDVFKDGKQIQSTTTFSCEKNPFSITKDPRTISYAPWVKDLFKEPGTYSIRIPYEGKTYETVFTVQGEGFFGSIWNTLFNRPIYNLLILFATWSGNDLGWAIILLTLLIKFILLIPTHKMLESQKEMQKIQPLLKEVQAKYKNDKNRQSQETLKLMQEHRVNPFGSCLPLLFQLPVLIALYFAVQHSMTASAAIFLYEPLKNVNIEALNPVFLSIVHLGSSGNIVFALLVGILQFVQMKMSFAALPKPAKKQVVKENGSMEPDLSQMNTYMTYIFPVMIVFICISSPTAIALYFVISTIFAIVQQYFVNKEKKRLL